MKYLALTFPYSVKILPFILAAEGLINTRQASAVYNTHIPPRGAQNTMILPEESPELLKSWDLSSQILPHKRVASVSPTVSLTY